MARSLRPGDAAIIKWRMALQSGDLSWVSFYNSGYVHISRLRKPKAKDNDDHALWDAVALCGVGRKYYGKPLSITGNSAYGSRERCKRCVTRWHSLGEPEISQPKSKAEPAKMFLAFGWHEVESIGIEFDLGKDGDPQKTADDTGKIWGEKRTERQRWQRGSRYVRICELFDNEYPFSVRYGIVGQPKTDDWTLKASLKECLEKASRLMAIGGMPKN